MTIKTEMEGFVSDLLTLVGFHKTVDVAGSESGTSLLRSDTGVQWAIHEKRPMACIICFTKKQLIRLMKIKDNIFHPKSIFFSILLEYQFILLLTELIIDLASLTLFVITSNLI